MTKRIEHEVVDNVELKHCSKCDDWYQLNAFHKDMYAWDLLDCICRKCEKEKANNWRKANPEKARQRDIANYYKTDSEKRRRRARKYRRANKDKAKQYNQKWEAKNRERRVQYRKDWRKANPEKKKAIDNRYMKKYLSTVRGSLSQRVSNLIRRTLKNGKNGAHWEDMMGFTYDQLKAHLNKTMPAGYTWDDLDKLHLDHITPISAHNFEKVTDEDFKRAWALKNLQLLPAKENMQKGAKLDKHFQPSLIFGDTK